MRPLGPDDYSVYLHPPTDADWRTRALAAEALLVEAREVLRPFAGWLDYQGGDPWFDSLPDTHRVGGYGPTLGALRAARALLRRLEGGEDQ